MSLQGVICCSLDDEISVRDTLDKLLDLNSLSTVQDIPCFSFNLKNKYYQTTIHLIDYYNLPTEKKKPNLLDSCQALILNSHGCELSVDKLDAKVKQFEPVGGEPRIVLYGDISDDSDQYKTLRDWSTKNGYDLININDDDAGSQLIDSLSAYKWKDRINRVESENKPQLNDETLRKLTDFDNLLGKMSAYRDMPQLRGNPDDKNIVEIAEILSGLLGEDVDGFLDNDDD